jgi:hypothetical protein
MPGKKARQREQKAAGIRQGGLRVFIAIAVVLSLLAAWTLLAYSGALDAAFRQKGKKGKEVSTASFNSNTPSKEYIYAGGRLVATEELTTTAATPPGGLSVTAVTVGQVHMTWNWSPAQGETLDHFVVERSQSINGSPLFFTPTPPNATSFDQSFNFGTVSSTGVVSGSVITYLYRVLAVNTAGGTSLPSNFDLVTTIAFAQDNIQQFSTVVNKQDLAELRVAVNAVRTAAELDQFTTWTDPDLSQTSITIKTEHITDLRGKLNDALNKINPPAPSYTDPTLQKQSTQIMKVHFNELRKGVRHRST